MVTSNRKKATRHGLVIGRNKAHHEAVIARGLSNAAGRHKNKVQKSRQETRRRAIESE